VDHPAKEEGIGLVEVLGRVTMQFLVREHYTMIAAPVQCDIDGIPPEPPPIMVATFVHGSPGIALIDPATGKRLPTGL
jgi:hypothetical protein